MNDFKYLYYLTQVDGLGPVRIKRLLDVFKKAENILKAETKMIEEVNGFSKKTVQSIFNIWKHENELKNNYDILCEKSEKMNISVLQYTDDLYPELLRNIYDPPLILYYKGKYEQDDFENLNNSLAIVGTRKPTDYGKKMAEKFASELSSVGISIVSGFARGIDTIAHRSVLENQNLGKTYAVFGNGVDVIYPPENKKLYDGLISVSCAFSEYQVSEKPDAVNFPSRNRIISGMTNGVIIIESGTEGGALITAHFALDQSREVFAVPGYVTSKLSSGTNYLIKKSFAKLVENIDDVLEEVSHKIKSNKDNASRQQKDISKISLSENERIIYENVSKSPTPLHIDDISEKTELNISDCLVNLLNLEFKGLVKQLPGKIFSLE